MSKKEKNKGPQERDYPGYKTMRAVYSLIGRVIRPQMDELEGLGLKNPVALRGALGMLAIGHRQCSDFYYVASLPEAGLNRGLLPPKAYVNDVAGGGLRITFNDEAGNNVEVLAVPAASRRGVDAIIQNQPGIFGIAVDKSGDVRCSRAFKTAAALNSPVARTSSLPILQQPRISSFEVCA
jgi:hypothetical protein